MRLSQRDVAAIIARLERIDEERQQILDLLLPDSGDEGDDACAHPDEVLRDLSTLGDERYQCTACGAEFTQHPRTINPED
jgi:hypothetical protein